MTNSKILKINSQKRVSALITDILSCPKYCVICVEFLDKSQSDLCFCDCTCLWQSLLPPWFILKWALQVLQKTVYSSCFLNRATPWHNYPSISVYWLISYVETYCIIIWISKRLPYGTNITILSNFLNPDTQKNYPFKYFQIFDPFLTINN